ncbi:hypothetical protein UAY_01098 [Enterococcus moraviensis ATCC BAA-383]|uniref:Uncharacterized protein n=1 Tax=Enterococcus moraviensis ATCC BAA-383 TaxID=1158609 RepID=R2QYL5_9ENTE|nr:hypothetical protein [Enterococcus moraviensis]EOI01690.1 hypothetical protein UAY_01098 [Enterococcus moraviensis ATCC BAA-383]EOT73775.1 hypothetical protein I586_00769 [Enterococcus moraviensis ATCC BAA-383]OJG69336.1 hypothetical protein RV09_GL000735 [Enterococcus moraviensis]
MGLFERLFNKEKTEIKTNEAPLSPTIEENDGWQEITGYIPVESTEYQFVSLIATAIAAGDQPESEFSIKRILKRNPEAQLVSVIATSIASADHAESQFVIRSIKEKKTS